MPPAKKNSRPRLDAVIRHIREGSYDTEMGQLKGAIEDRNRKLQQEVLKLVKKTFGEDYVVAPERDYEPLGPIPRSGGKLRPRPGGPVDPEVAAAEQAALEHEQRLAEELGNTTPDPLGDDPEEGMESRSPVIGSIDPSAEPQEEPPGVTVEIVDSTTSAMDEAAERPEG